MLGSSCIGRITCFFFLRIDLLWLGDLRLQRKQRFSAKDILDGICISTTGIISDVRLDARIDVGKTLPLH